MQHTAVLLVLRQCVPAGQVGKVHDDQPTRRQTLVQPRQVQLRGLGNQLQCQLVQARVVSQYQQAVAGLVPGPCARRIA